MASRSQIPDLESLSLPLADYFFICGVETSKIFEPSASGGAPADGAGSAPIASEIIDEDGALDIGAERPGSSKENWESPQRPARFSYEARKSISSIMGLERLNVSSSNRSSATVKPIPAENPLPVDDEDFERALKSFATERDTFLEDINTASQFSAGQIALPNKPRPRPKTTRISDDPRRDDKGVGSIRRRIPSINPLSRSSTQRVAQRQSKRLSGYNSVMPAPQRFKPASNMHPLKRHYEPVLLDQYPSTRDDDEEAKRRNKFPDFVPMFVFPNDINVISSDSRPRSTWHAFTMTGGDGAKQHGMCLIAWMPLPESESEELERQCDQWRNHHMSNEEREMAKDLSERLASMRARLSELLSRLSQIPYGTEEREAHEEEIGQVEERIGLMTDALRPVRHGAASKIDGLTDGSATGFWVPRAYGVLGRDGNLTSFWKEWLRAVAIPITHGTLLHVPASSPTVGTWQPLERYVVNLCTEAPSPINSKVQVELQLRELRIHARKDAVNEIPGSRNIDLYPLFRCLNVPDIVILFEYVLAESRIILLSSHTSMLHSVCAAITQLLYPLKWTGAYVPVLPARLIEMLEAPCPYIFGIERRYDNVELPEDDFVLVDLDQGVIEATSSPAFLPRQQRRKLMSILQLAAPHHNRYGVPLGPPAYAVDAYPFDTFPSESPSVFSSSASPSNLAHLAGLSSAAFGNPAGSAKPKPPLHNVFLQFQKNTLIQSIDRPTTSSTLRTNSPPSPSSSPTFSSFPKLSTNGSQALHTDSASALQNSLREKRSGILHHSVRRNSTVYIKPLKTSKLANVVANIKSAKFGLSNMRRPSNPLINHQSTASVSTIPADSMYGGSSGMSNYAPSIYAQSTLAASTIMPNALMQSVQNTSNQKWCEGHCLVLQRTTDRPACGVCDEKSEETVYRCTGCNLYSHPRCTAAICLVCPAAFHPDQIIAAFARCFASLFYTYRKFLIPATGEQKKSGQIYGFNMERFQKSVPSEQAAFIGTLRETQAFNQFIHEACTTDPSAPSNRLFDSLISSKRSRGTASRMFSRSASSPSKLFQNFLADTSDHLWATAATPPPNGRMVTPPAASAMAVNTMISNGAGSYSNYGPMAIDHPRENGESRRVLPGKLDGSLMKEPRMAQGKVQVRRGGNGVRRKMVPSMIYPDGQGNQAFPGQRASKLRD